MHIVVGAVVGGVINLATNWNNCDGFWQYAAAFGVGAGSGALAAATGGASLAVQAAVAVGTGALTSATNSVIAQTGKNFGGMGNIDWGGVGMDATIGGVSGFASFGASRGASSILKGDLILPGGMRLNNNSVFAQGIKQGIAGTAGGYTGGFVGGYLYTGDIEAAHQSGFKGGMFGLGLGTATGFGGAYINAKQNGLNPWTGRSPNAFNYVNYDFTPDSNGDNITIYRGTTGSEGKGGPLFFTDNPEYAATYVRNGGQVVKVTISKTTYLKMYFNGHIETFQGTNPNFNTPSTEYKVNPAYAPDFLKIFK